MGDECEAEPPKSCDRGGRSSISSSSLAALASRGSTGSEMISSVRCASGDGCIEDWYSLGCSTPVVCSSSCPDCGEKVNHGSGERGRAKGSSKGLSRIGFEREVFNKSSNPSIPCVEV